MPINTETEFLAPNVENYQIPKGTVTFKPTGVGATARPLGNMTSIEFTPKVDVLDHFSTQAGSKIRDFVAVTSKMLSVKMALEEFNPENLALGVMGAESVSSEGAYEIDILSEAMTYGELVVTGTNDVGPRYKWTFPHVGIKPEGSLALIGDGWNKIELTADILLSAGKFGTVQLLGY